MQRKGRHRLYCETLKIITIKKRRSYPFYPIINSFYYGGELCVNFDIIINVFKII